VSLASFSRLDHAHLDDPIWAALTSDHAYFAEGQQLAKRYPPDIAPFAGVVERSAEAGAALRELVPVHGQLALFAVAPFVPPIGLEVERAASMEQMIATAPLDSYTAGTDVLNLTPEQAGEMQQLAALTKPGPFGPRTHMLGRYMGIRVGNALVAMAGERLRFTGYVEVTGVCVHPDHRRKGYARALIAAVVARAMREHLVPFLHVYTTNASAIALYRSLNFVVRRQLYVTVLRAEGNT
jgi:ribosomal protein S18 acetylase RimI-like enzyme